MDKLTKLSKCGYIVKSMNTTHGDVLNKLGEYESLNLTPTQLQEIDKLYAEKCKEVVELKEDISQSNNDCAGLSQENELFKAEIKQLKDRIKDLEYACKGHMVVIHRLKNDHQNVCDKWMKLKEENDKLKAELNQNVNTLCRCNECKYFSTDGCAEDTMYCNLHGCYISGVNGCCHRAEKALAEMESGNEAN